MVGGGKLGIVRQESCCFWFWAVNRFSCITKTIWYIISIFEWSGPPGQGLPSGPFLTDGLRTPNKDLKTSVGEDKVWGIIFTLEEGDIHFKRVCQSNWPLFESSGN